MKAYLAGKIAGDNQYVQKFADGESKLQSEGFVVLNPATLPGGMTAADYMRVCFAMIDCADVVAFMPDWSNSRGAQLENAYCQYIGKQTYYLSANDPECGR